MVVKPAKKLFVDRKYQENIEGRPCGLRRVNLNNTVTKIQYDKRHFEERFGIENDPEVFHIKTIHPDGNCLSMVETPIEKEFGIKKKLWSLTERRNGMELRIPGDKYYKASEHLSNFFREGGLVPGSTNTINFNKTPLYVKTLTNWEKNILVDYDKPKEKEKDVKGKTKKEPPTKKDNKGKQVPKGKKK